MENKKQLYITTAIPYVNGEPHLGHAIDYLIADVMKRYYRARGYQVQLQVGTDEHGNKIANKAKSLNIAVEDLVSKNANIFRNFIDSLGVEYDSFIRTSDPAHMRRVQKIWQKLVPHIYKAKYEGWYCQSCEAFITRKEYEKNGGHCPIHRDLPCEKIAEENYYLRIADFKDQIKHAIEKEEMKITPSWRKKEFLNLLVDMPDVSISRPKTQVSWGIEVPGDDQQVMYVWLDALSNYLTVLGYPEKDITGTWPAELQIVGKDILRFHAGIWPTILLGLGLELPHNLLAHGFVTLAGEKMSKSLGNVIAPREILAKYGLDPFRYYFLHHGSVVEDIDFTWDKYEASYLELANDLGNLVQRLANLCEKQGVGNIRAEKDYLDEEKIDQCMTNYKINECFDYLWTKIQALNKKIDQEKPWALAKSEPEKARLLLTELGAKILAINAKLAWFLPGTAAKIDTIFQAEKVHKPETTLFPKKS